MALVALVACGRGTMAAMFHRISVTGQLVTADETEYFVQTPNSLRLWGLNRKREHGTTFGTIHQSETARQCFRDGRYDYSVQQHSGRDYDTAQLPFTDWPAPLQTALVNRLKKRLHDAGIFDAMKGNAEEGINT